MIEDPGFTPPTPVDERAPVQSTEEVAEGLFLTRLSSPTIAAHIEPGQFVQVRVREGAVPLLRLPLSVAAVDRAAGTIDVLYEAVGPKTTLMSQLRVADRVGCLGPLGNRFPAPRPDQTAVLIGGGVGLPPLLFFGHTLRQAGHGDTVLLVGARTSVKHLALDRLLGAAAAVALATDDGSAGHAGLVTELLEERLSTGATGGLVVYTCGPHPMMRAVASICERAEVMCLVSLEAYMACGYGVCVGCVVETVPVSDGRARSEHERYSRICVDGPVYDATRIIWD